MVTSAARDRLQRPPASTNYVNTDRLVPSVGLVRTDQASRSAALNRLERTSASTAFVRTDRVAASAGFD
jgi:hypothetical protein